jgi:hypothetical protein
MVQQLAIGELSEVFEDASGFRMVRVLERRSESTRTVAEVSAAIEAELRRESQQAAENKYLDELRTSATIWTVIPLEEVSAQASELATVSGAAPAPEKKTRTTPGGLLGSQAKALSAD